MLSSSKGPAHIQFVSPKLWNVSLLNKANDKLTFVGDVNLTRCASAGISKFMYDTKSLSNQDLKTNFKNFYRVALGLIYSIKSNLDLKLGYAIEQSPVKNSDTRLTNLPDGSAQWLSFFIQIKCCSTRVDLGIACALKNESKISSDKRPTNQGLVDGKFDVDNLILDVQLSQAF